MANGDFVKGFVLGVAVTVVTPLVLTALVGGSRPLTRAITRGTGIVGDKLREATAEMAEIAEDMLAEMRQDPARAREATEPHVRAVGDEEPSPPRAAKTG